MSVTEGFPTVRVPVLSKTTVSTFPARSRYSPPLISTPHCAPMLVPTRSAAGVATPRAHGHAITTTETNASTEKSRPMWPKRYQDSAATAAAAMTTGTK